MDEKIVKEAIELINHCIDIQDKCKMVTHANISAIDEDIKAYQVAIEALEKQLPKKPDIMDYILGDINFKCPTCKSEYICEKGYEHFYCPNCGQKIKWSE